MKSYLPGRARKSSIKFQENTSEARVFWEEFYAIKARIRWDKGYESKKFYTPPSPKTGHVFIFASTNLGLFVLERLAGSRAEFGLQAA